MYKNRRQEITGIVEIKNSPHGDAETLVKRFNRKVRNSGILEECRERRYFKSNSERRREKLEEKERIIRKVNQRRASLLKPGDYLSKKRRPRR